MTSLTQPATKQHANPNPKLEPEHISLTTLSRERLSPVSYLPKASASKISLRAIHGAQSSTETSGIGTSAVSSFDMSFDLENQGMDDDKYDLRSPRTPERDRRRVSPRRQESYERATASCDSRVVVPPSTSDYSGARPRTCVRVTPATVDGPAPAPPLTAPTVYSQAKHPVTVRPHTARSGSAQLTHDVITVDSQHDMTDNRGFLNVTDDDPTLMDYSEWDHKFNRRRGSRTPSPLPSPRLSRSGSGRDSRRMSKRFLSDTQSTWVKWSQQRRNSFRNRIKMMEEKDKETEKSRASLPIKKARKESSRFLNPDEEYISEEEEQTPPKPTKKKKKKKKKGDKTEPPHPRPRKKIKLTERQWQVLMDYWDNDCFVRSRYLGILFAMLAVTLGVVSIVTEFWSFYPGEWFISVILFFHNPHVVVRYVMFYGL